MLCIRQGARVGAWRTRASITPPATLRVTSPPWSKTLRRAFGGFEDLYEDNGTGRKPQPTDQKDSTHDQEDKSTIRGFQGARKVPFTNKRGVFQGTVFAPQPESVGPEDLVRGIESPQPNAACLQPNNNSAVLVLLVTPSFAKYALSIDLPLAVMERFHSNPTHSKPLDAFTAVVDKLPVPSISPDGQEGIAYAFITDPEENITASSQLLQANASKPGSLTFQLPPSEHHRAQAMAMQLQLAHTIFTTGLPSTLVHTQYQFDPLSGKLRKSSTKRLESQSITLPVTDAVATVIRAPMVPLTPFRQVQTCMGNIVRKLSPDPMAVGSSLRREALDWLFKNPGKELPKQYQVPEEQWFPASQELESAVSAYFDKLDIAPEPVQVWALIFPAREWSGRLQRPRFGAIREENVSSLWPPKIRPQDFASIKDDEGWERGWHSFRSGRIKRALVKGGRLCKVLSGGGGWGKKAGLLSLDPDSSYSTRELRGDQGWEFSFDGQTPEEMMELGKKQALGEVVKAGEKIMFFLAQSEIPETAAKQGLRRSVEVNHEGDPPSDLLFGVLPSSLGHDGPRPSSATQQDLPPYQHIPGLFGLLSEGGMAITLESADGTQTQSKLDVPYLTLQAQDYTPRYQAPELVTSRRNLARRQRFDREQGNDEQQKNIFQKHFVSKNHERNLGNGPVFSYPRSQLRPPTMRKIERDAPLVSREYTKGYSTAAIAEEDAKKDRRF